MDSKLVPTLALEWEAWFWGEPYRKSRSFNQVRGCVYYRLILLFMFFAFSSNKNLIFSRSCCRVEIVLNPQICYLFKGSKTTWSLGGSQFTSLTSDKAPFNRLLSTTTTPYSIWRIRIVLPSTVQTWNGPCTCTKGHWIRHVHQCQHNQSDTWTLRVSVNIYLQIVKVVAKWAYRTTGRQ